LYYKYNLKLQVKNFKGIMCCTKWGENVKHATHITSFQILIYNKDNI